MYLRMAKRLLLETDKRLLWKIAYHAGFKGILSVQKHKRRLKRGQFFPPFLFISAINSCSLRCQGCWVDVSAKQAYIDADRMKATITQAQQMGNSIFGILGGEPLMHPQLIEILRQHPDCYFLLFTNGHLVTDELAKELRRLGNVTPLVSIEGNEPISDERRGQRGVFAKTMAGLQRCLENRLITGVCTSVCQSNIDDLLTEEWVDRLIELGVMYVWYYTYRPAGPDPRPDLALTPEQQLRARRFIVEMRAKKPIGVLDAYYDHAGRALCPAVTGSSHHVGPWGDIEPCPVIQLAKESIDDARGLERTILESEFLADFRQTVAPVTRGCILLERPDLLIELAKKHGAHDSTARGTVFAELAAMQSRASQFDPQAEIPEKSWIYRFAKKHWFGDFGVYETLGK